MAKDRANRQRLFARADERRAPGNVDISLTSRDRRLSRSK